MIGSSLFALGAVGGTWPGALPSALRDPQLLGRVYFAGSIFFTAAAGLQWLEALNGDVADAWHTDGKPAWRWLGWRPRNLGYLASAVQLAGTVLFNIDTFDALVVGSAWRSQDLLVWTPNVLGCLCFLVASYLAFAEVSQAGWSFEPRCVSWWVAVINVLGSIAFQISALYAVVTPSPAGPQSQWLASFFTLVGALCFLFGAYLLVPEVFDE